MSQKKNDWKKTLNLPDTAFPMKAQLNQKEVQILKNWQEQDIYRKIISSRRDRPLYILHDGPPYANGMIHLGTALNKILKDFIVKSKTMEGFQAPYVPGWDCHGLPIEHKVDKLLGERKAKMDVIAIRDECRKYAEEFLDRQRADFIRLGVFGAWREPYTTLQPEYEAAIIRHFNSFVRRGEVYRRKRPVHWCISCQTALAEAEVEYHNHTSPSVYVKFRLRGLPGSLARFSDRPVEILIWTTTPWTLPANLAIAVHSEYDYSLFEVKGECLIAASRLVPVIADLAGGKYEKLAEFKGSELAGLKAQHPLFPERDSLLINTDYVLLDQGTGCVHTAPGHGEEDYQAGLQFHLDIYSPVDGTGRFDASAGQYAGQVVFAANATIVEDLKRSGRLLQAEEYGHSYPHCWRCKNPVIFRATEQWFISMDAAGLRQKALQAIRGVRWLPEWGEERIHSMIENRPDWCISRQRHWGVPLPVFFCADCGEPLLDPSTIENVAVLFGRHGSNHWYQKEAVEFVPAGTACGKCGGSVFQKSYDIIDVWFESGSSHSVLDRTAGHAWPADVYIEGGDQYRGWFHSSLLVGIAVKGAAPFRTVISHGWTLDDQGRAMSKSLGNTIEPQAIADESGAEIIRLWVSMINYQEDVRLGAEIMARVVESYRKIRNTWRFMLGVLADYRPDGRPLDPARLGEIDRFILQRFQQVKEKILRAYQSYEYFTVFHAALDFFTVDLSAFYLNCNKDNLYCNGRDSSERRATQSAVFLMLRESLQLMAPILSFTSEEAWGFLPAYPGKEESVHLCLFPAVDPRLAKAADPEKWARLLSWRDRVQKEIEEARNAKVIGDSLEAEVRITAPRDGLDFLAANDALLRQALGVAALTLAEGGAEAVAVEKSAGAKCPRCWNRFTPATGSRETDLCPRCADVVG